MTTDKEEHQSMIVAMQSCPQNAKVFIGGLGLGLILLYLAKSNNTKEVLVAEISQKVIDAIEPRLRLWFNEYYPSFKWQVIRGDALEEVKKHGKFDWIFFDIWSNPHQTYKDQPKEEEIKKIARPYLTKHGKLTLWTEIIQKMREKRNPQLEKLYAKVMSTCPGT